MFTAAATAATPTTEAELTQSISDVFDICTGDMTLFQKWLYDLYGQVICEPGGNVTLISEVVGFMNVMAMALAIVISLYVVISGIMRTASEGEVLGKAYSTVWLPLRYGVGVSLLIPAPGMANVFSVCQALMMGLILAASNAADILHVRVMESIFRPSEASIVVNQYKLSQEAQTMLAQLGCTIAYRDQHGISSRPDMLFKIRRNGVYGELKPQLSANGFTSAVQSSTPEIESIEFVGGSCGEMVFPSRKGDEVDTEGSSPLSIALNKMDAPIINAYLMAYAELFPIAQAMVAPTSQSLSVNGRMVRGLGDIGNYSRIQDPDVDASLVNDSALITAAYLTAIDNFRDNLIANASREYRDNLDVDDWIDRNSKMGFASLGLMYFEIPKFHGAPSAKLNDALGNGASPTYGQSCVSEPEGWDRLKFWTRSNCDEKLNVFQRYATAKVVHQEAGKSQSSSGTATPSIVSFGDGESDPSGPLALYINATLLDALVNGEYLQLGFNLNDGYNPPALTDPFVTATRMGDAALSVLTLMQGAVIFSESFVTAGESTGASSFLLSAIIGFFKFFKAKMFALMVLMAMNAFTLALLVPIMPILVWIFALIRYLIVTIEAMAAVPLAVTKILTPEGEGILGTRMEQVIALIAGIFLRPTLLVIGLVASISISFIALSVVNTIMAEYMTSVKPGVIGAVFICLLYALLVIAVVKRSIAVISELGDNVLNWMSAGIGSFGAEDKGMAESTAAQASGGTQAGAKAVMERSERRAGGGDGNGGGPKNSPTGPQGGKGKAGGGDQKGAQEKDSVSKGVKENGDTSVVSTEAPNQQGQNLGETSDAGSGGDSKK
ncbi:DotA/TraY family protein [Ferrimonas marina]|uniref:DotA/TraY family protein n=1 Tax=Ferrimonas marina TaxID=299255 RepID=UPI00146FEAA4|nr:DotA/TraY family protein [Ferrimonas marina]